MSRLIVLGRGQGRASPLRGRVQVPGDKSISHRALMLGALAEGESTIEGFLRAGDCLATVSCLRQLGIEIEVAGTGPVATAIVRGRGLRGLRPASAPLDCRRSGTSMRLLAGILAGQPFDSQLTGDPQLLRRPMRRITEPLCAMGARIEDHEGHAPLVIHGGAALAGMTYSMPVASAQVKSAILLAGLYANGPVIVEQPGPARDHTERMLASQAVPAWQGATPVIYDEERVALEPRALAALRPFHMTVPGDFSSAGFLVAAALLVPGSHIEVAGVGINPTRTGLMDVLQQMGVDVGVTTPRYQGGEPVADLRVRGSALLEGTTVAGSTVVRMIDEFPILAVVATQARGTTVVRDASELRVKETDRIAMVVDELRRFGARIQGKPDGFVVDGPTALRGAHVDSHGDHRLAMALTIAALMAEGESVIEHTACISDSFPGFVEILQELGAEIDVVS